MPQQQRMDDKDTGYDLVGLNFEDDGEPFVITETGENNGTPTLLYKNPNNPREDGKEHESTVAEVRGWYNTTKLRQAANKIVPTRKHYINDLAYET